MACDDGAPFGSRLAVYQEKTCPPGYRMIEWSGYSNVCGWEKCYPGAVPPAPDVPDIDDCTISANLCEKQSKCYVGDEIANAPGGCGKGCYIKEDPGFFGECCGGYEKKGNIFQGYKCVVPDVPDKPDEPDVPSRACPRGEKYTAIFSDCDEGYIPFMVPSILPGFSSNVCICSASGKGKELLEEGYGEEWSLSKIMNMLPQLLIVMIVVSIIGAFRK